jgi:ribose/xylose/arabinose/galactoside ABC-type transport system permease subunit
MNATSKPTPDLPQPQLLGHRHFRLLGSALGPFLGLLLVLALFWAADTYRASQTGRPGTFATIDGMQVVLRNTSAVGTAALGMTIIIIAGGIDLSAGTAIALCATVTAYCFHAGCAAPVGILAGLMTGCVTGFVNGSLISALRVVPFIITLGTMTLFRGTGRIIAGDTPIRANEEVRELPWMLSLQEPFPEPEWLLVSPGVWVMLVLALLVGCLLNYTVFGRHAFALGSNESTARLCGINVNRTRIAVYTIAGIFIGVAGLFQFVLLYGEGDPAAGTGKELEIIAAVVIGGGSLSGGRGSVLGTISGAAIMAVIQHGCVILSIPDPFQEIIIGVIIVAAVTLDQFRQRKLAG